MPRNSVVYPLSAAFIEGAHDFGISFVWPGIEPVKPRSCLNINLLKSAERQPYQECFGREVYPTLAAKASYIFYHLATGHLFSNGNKRTAALCLDAFLAANSQYLTLSNDEVEALAQGVASAGEHRRGFNDVLLETTELISSNIIPVSSFRTANPALYRALHRYKWAIRKSYRNVIGTLLAQEE